MIASRDGEAVLHRSVTAHRLGALITVLLFGQIGCDQRADDPVARAIPPAELRDSAGIRIVRYQLGPASARAALQWAVEPVPAWQPIEDASGNRVAAMQVANAELLGDGGMAIGVRNQGEVRVFDASGALVRRLRVPKSSRSIAGPWRVGGSELAVLDLAANRISIIDTSAMLRWSIAFPHTRWLGDAGRLREVVGFDSGRAPIVMVHRNAPGATGRLRSSMSLLKLDSTGAVVTTLGPFPGVEVVVEVHRGGNRLGLPAFGRVPLATTRNGMIAVADNDAYDVRLMTARGELKSIVRAVIPPVLLDESDFRAAAAAELANLRRGRKVTDKEVAMFRAASNHTRLPALGSLILDENGDLWVEEFRRPTEQARRVVRYGPDGRLHGAFELAESLELLNARGDRIVVRARDERTRGHTIQVLKLRNLPPARVEVAGR